MLLIGGAAPTALQGRGALQDIDQRALIAPHVKHVARVRKVRDLGPAVEDGLRHAMRGVPGPVFVECPVDLLYDEALIRQWYADAAGKGTSLGDRLLRWYLNRHAREMFAGAANAATPARRAARRRRRADDGAIARAAEALARAERPLMVIGSQALLLAEHAAAIAAGRRPAAGSRSTSPAWRAACSGPDHPLQMRHARRNALREADCVLLAGVPCDFRLDYGRHVRRSATLIAANRSAADARHEPPADDRRDRRRAASTLMAVAERAGDRAGRADWVGDPARARRRARARDRRAGRGARRDTSTRSRSSARSTVRRATTPCSSPTAATSSRPRRTSCGRAGRSPGSTPAPSARSASAPASRSARGWCGPTDEVWLIWGDGASGYGLVEFDTFVRHGVPVIAVVGNDASWAQIAREQVKMLNDDVGTVLARSDYHAVIEGFGGAGIEVKTLAEVPAALQRAREIARGGRPVLVNVWLDRTDFREGSISM